MYEITINTDTFFYNPTFYLDKAGAKPCPAIIPLVQGLAGTLRVRFIGSNAPTEDMNVLLAIRTLKTEEDLYRTDYASSQTDDDGTLFFDLNLDVSTAELLGAMFGKETLTVKAGIVVVNPDQSVRQEYQTTGSITRTVLAQNKFSPIPNATAESEAKYYANLYVSEYFACGGLDCRIKCVADKAVEPVEGDVKNLCSVQGTYALKADVTEFYVLKTDLPDTSSFAKSADVTEFYALKSEVPSTDDFAKKADVTEYYATKSEIPSTDDFAKKETVSEFYALKSEVPSTDNLATKADVTEFYALKSDVPSTDNLATKSDVTEYYALKTDIPSTEGLAKASDVTEYYALKSDVPSTDGLAKASDVTEFYALKSEVPSTAGLATKESVSEFYALKTDVPDTSTLATKEALEKETTCRTQSASEIYACIAKETSARESADNGLASKDAVSEFYALKSDVPSTEGLATQSELAYVCGKIPSTEGLATTSEVSYVCSKIPDVSGFATKESVTEFYAEKSEVPDVRACIAQTCYNNAIWQRGAGSEFILQCGANAYIRQDGQYAYIEQTSSSSHISTNGQVGASRFNFGKDTCGGIFGTSYGSIAYCQPDNAFYACFCGTRSEFAWKADIQALEARIQALENVQG